MKLLIASDIHGSATYARTLLERINDENPDHIVLLGDFLYHGPRNDLPLEYSPKQVYALLNEIAPYITAVRGNCDAEVDQAVLDFPCRDDYATVGDESTVLFCTHGHIYKPKDDIDALNLPPEISHIDAFLSGHTHKKVLNESNGVLFVNPGSVSIPKDGTRSFAVYDNGIFTLKTLDDGAVIDEKSINGE